MQKNNPVILEEIPCDIILEHDAKNFRPIAQRALQSLLKRRESTSNFKLYNYEINKLILHEIRRNEHL